MIISHVQAKEYAFIYRLKRHFNERAFLTVQPSVGPCDNARFPVSVSPLKKKWTYFHETSY